MEKAAVSRGPSSSRLDPRADVEPKGVHRAAWRWVRTIFVSRCLFSRLGSYEAKSQVSQASRIGHTGVRCGDNRELVIREIVQLGWDDGGEAVRVEI